MEEINELLLNFKREVFNICNNVEQMEANWRQNLSYKFANISAEKDLILIERLENTLFAFSQNAGNEFLSLTSRMDDNIKNSLVEVVKKYRILLEIAENNYNNLNSVNLNE